MTNKYKFRKVDGDKLVFTDFNFKLAVIDELMYGLELLEPKFDTHEFVELHAAREINIDDEGYELIPEVVEYFEQFEIEKELADHITQIGQDGGNPIYMQLISFWDGEDDVFNIRSFKDAAQFKNLKRATLFYEEEPSALFAEARRMGIECETL